MSQEPTAPAGAHGVPSVFPSAFLDLEGDQQPKEMDTGPGAPGNGEPDPVFAERDRLVLLTPCYGFQCSTLFRDAVHLALQEPTARFRCADGKVRTLPIVAMAINKPGDSHIDRARNTTLFEYEQTPYQLACWMDGDQPFEPEHLARIWSHLMAGKRVVGGLVALKSIVPTFVCNATHGQRPDAQGLIQPDDVGTGCLGFRRDVLDEIRTRWPQYVRQRLASAINYRPDDAHVDRALAALAELGYSADLTYKAMANSPVPGATLTAIFRSGIVHRDGGADWLSEDWMFCHMCHLLGIPIHADTLVNIKHIGPQVFPPPPEEIVQAALKVTSGRHPPFNKKLAAAASAALAALHADIADDSITILHATRRGAQAEKIRQLWFDRAIDKHIEYIFAVDLDDLATRETLQDYQCVTVSGNPGGIVKPINEAAKYSKGRILVMAADDCEPPVAWDRQIREALKGQLHEPRLLWTSDGHSQQPVITHPIMTRALYDEQGWFFCPDYPHLFCDTELTYRAAQAGQIIDARHIVLRHDHPMFTGQKPDALHLERNSREAWRIGSEIFARRNPLAVNPPKDGVHRANTGPAAAGNGASP